MQRSSFRRGASRRQHIERDPGRASALRSRVKTSLLQIQLRLDEAGAGCGMLYVQESFECELMKCSASPSSSAATWAVLGEPKLLIPCSRSKTLEES
jgi:hypothetical protein